MSRGTVRRTYQAPQLGLIFGCRHQHRRTKLDFSLARPADSHPLVLAQKSTRPRNYPQPDVIVSIVGIVPVAVCRTAVFRIVVERTTAQHSVVPAPPSLSRQSKSREYLLSEFPGIAMHEVCFPALERVDDTCQFNLTSSVIPL
jgi:hypothetical protein